MAAGLPSCLTAHPEGSVLRLRLQPRARRAGPVGILGDRLKFAVCGPPVEGKANAELCRELAALCHLSKAAVCILQGETSREKAVLLRGMSPEQLAARLGL